MTRGRIVRLLSGLGVLALAGGAAALAQAMPAPHGAPRGAATVPVPPPVATLVCPGPVRLLTASEGSTELSYDPAFAPAPAGAASAARAVTLAPADGSLVAAPMDWRLLGADAAAHQGSGAAAHQGSGAARATVLTEAPLAGAGVVTAAPAGGVPADVGAAVATTTTAGDLRGLAAAPCARPGTDLWLVGGSTELGASARLVMQNPGATAATVTIEMWGANGPLALAGSSQLLVPPGTERAVLLEGLAAEQHAIAVHLAVSGGSVGAYLQDAALRGFVAAGIDLVTQGPAPSTRLSVGGVTLGVDRAGEVPSVLRLLAPGAESVRVSISVLGEDGPVDRAPAGRLDLAAGNVTDVSLDDLPAGKYTIVVESTGPVIANAMLVRVGKNPGEPIERAWTGSVATSAGGLIGLPRGPNAAVVLGAPAQPGAGASGVATGTLRVVDAASGAVTSERVRVPVGSSVVVQLTDLAPSGESAAVELAVDDGSAIVMSAVLATPLSGGAVGFSVIAASAPPTPRAAVVVRQDPVAGFRLPIRR